MADDELLSEEEAALVFRRAAELEAIHGAPAGGFDAATLEHIGVEAGLSPEAVRRAVAEVRSNRSAPAPAPEVPRWVPRQLSTERVVPVGAPAVTRHVDAYLSAQHLRICRRRGNVTVWEASRSLGANLARGLDLGDRMRLSRVDGVELLVEPVDAGTFVRVTLDLARMHRNAISGRLAAAGISTAGVVAAGVGLALGAPEVALVLPATTGTAAGAYFGTRSTYLKHLRRALDAVELVLDELEHEHRSRV